MSDEKRFGDGHREPYDVEQFDRMREHARDLFNALSILVDHMKTNRLSALQDIEVLGDCIRAQRLVDVIEGNRVDGAGQ